MAGLFTRMKDSLKHSWNIFTDPKYLDSFHNSNGPWHNSSYSPSRTRSSYSNERSLIASIITRIAIDVSAIDIRHVRVDDQGRYLEDVNSYLQDCLTVKANLDQAARQFRQDIAMTLCEKGCIAIAPIETDVDPTFTNAYDVKQLRVGEIVGWFPEEIKADLYNQKKGIREHLKIPKTLAAVVENPLYAVMNEPNSTLKRLIRKINLLDTLDDQTASGKLDLIIQLPYVIKSDARRKQAEQRRKDIEYQLNGSKYGIAYTDGTEKVQQLNRPVENNLLDQIKYLTDKLYMELGLTPEVMNGTADEKTMLNYYSRTVEPIVQAVAEAMKATFLSQTARTRGQSIMYFRDPFKLIPMEQFAEIVDKLTRNEVLTSNEIRAAIGIRPSKDPKADKLINSNMPQPDPNSIPETSTPVDNTGNDAAVAAETSATDSAIQSGLDEANDLVDQMFSDLGIENG